MGVSAQHSSSCVELMRQLHTRTASRWRKTAGRQRWAAAVALSLALMVLQGLIVRPDSYEGHFVPLFAAQQWLYQRWYKSHDYYLGRRDEVDPSPRGRCCSGAHCRRHAGSNNAVVTIVRTDAYLPMFLELECSLASMSRHLPLAVLVVRDELAPTTVEAIEAVARVVYVEPIFFNNVASKRFGLNWLKIRLWELREYDAVLYVDADVEVRTWTLPSVFELPTDFATVLDLNKAGYWYSAMGRSQAGVMLLRPCPAVAAHMLKLASSNRLLQYPFHDAEQDFFDWYFRYTRMTLPPEYNTLSEHVVWRLMTGYPHYDALPAPPMSPKQLRVVSDAGGRVGSRGWWGRGRRSLLGGSVFDEPEWTLTALTPGGADVSILHHAVEEKPWHRRACQDARKHGIPWPYGLGRE